MGFYLAEPQGDDLGRCVERNQASGSSYPMGSLLLINASNEAAECGADPASIAGVSATSAGTDTSGFNIFAAKGFPPGKMQIITAKNKKFLAPYVGTLPAADGALYGVVKDSDGEWKVDFTETVATRVRLVGRRTGSPENIARVEVTFLDANLQDI